MRSHLRPDVDLSSTLVEKEHVLYEDQAVDLRHGRKEAVEDARGLEGLEVTGPGAPSCGGECDDEKVEHDR